MAKSGSYRSLFSGSTTIIYWQIIKVKIIQSQQGNKVLLEYIFVYVVSNININIWSKIYLT